MLYLNAAKKQKAFSRVSIIYTNLVRLHPTKPEVWIHAAKFAIDEHGDMAEARSFMQRGLRFCKGSRTLWLSYFRLELVYIAKVIRRQQILGLTGSGTAEKEFEDLDNPEADIVALPAVTQRDMGPSVATNEVVDRNALQALRATPALSGAIPIAIFDAAMNQFNGTSFAGEFVDLICNFDTIPCCVKVLQHVLDYLEKIDPSGSVTLDCWIRQPLIGVFHTTAQLAQALGVVFSRLRSSLDDHPSSNLVQRTVSWVSSYVQRDLDDSVKAVLRALLLRTLVKCRLVSNERTDPAGDFTASLLETASKNAKVETMAMLPWALDTWPSNQRLLGLQDALNDQQIVVND